MEKTWKLIKMKKMTGGGWGILFYFFKKNVSMKEGKKNYINYSAKC